MDWTLSTATVFRPYRSPKGSPALRYYQESTCASTAVIHAGMPVILAETTGFDRILRCSYATSNSEMPTTMVRLVGVAAEGSTSDGSTTGLSNQQTRRLAVYVADGKTEFLGYLKGAGPAASSMIGLNKGVIYDSTLNTYFIDSTNSTTSEHAAHITDIPDYAIGDTNGPVVFRFLSSKVSISI